MHTGQTGRLVIEAMVRFVLTSMKDSRAPLFVLTFVSRMERPRLCCISLDQQNRDYGETKTKSCLVP
jgi:hypothetical protein